jgi:hypothetical protein
VCDGVREVVFVCENVRARETSCARECVRVSEMSEYERVRA